MKLTAEQITDIIQWDVTNWSKALPYWKDHVPNFSGKKCLEIGGKVGGLSLWMALLGNEVVCTDIDNPKNRCQALHDKHGVASLITYEDLNLLQFNEQEKYDVIAMKSVLGGIARQSNSEDYLEKVMERLYKALKPGGHLLFAENLKASKLHQLARKYLVSWGGSWSYPSCEKVITAMSSFDKVDCKTEGFLGVFGTNEPTRNILGKADNLIINKIIPANWNYIVYGVATK